MTGKVFRLSNIINVPTDDPIHARRQKLLNVMLLAMAIGALLLLAALFVLAPTGLAGKQKDVRELYVASAPVLLGVAVTCVLNRYVSGQLASIVFLLLWLAIAVLLDEPRQVTDGRGLFMFATPILAASVLLPPWTSFIVAGLSSLIIVVISLTVEEAILNIPAVLGFFVFALVSYLSAQSLERALESLGAANTALRRNEEQLEEEVEERTQQLRDAQDELVRQEKLATLGQLAGSVAHELRNPLGAISSAAYLLNLILERPNPEVKLALKILEKEVDASERIISSLLNFARTKSPIRREVNLKDVVQEALSRIAVPASVEVVTQLDESLPPILADPDQLGQVFGNLILNAIQAMTLPNRAGTPEGGQLTIQSLITSPGLAAISFSDTGVGILPENLDKLFEPLFTTKAKGIGLGLALAKGLVEGHGGRVAVQSVAGKGSAFTVSLPFRSQNTQADPSL